MICLIKQLVRNSEYGIASTINSDKVLAVGDAASLCDPFLAEGIRPSLISSFYAAECLDQCLAGKVDDLNLYTNKINNNWGRSMAWGEELRRSFIDSREQDIN